jgi:imidazolonepropionase-like amidohydrolase
MLRVAEFAALISSLVSGAAPQSLVAIRAARAIDPATGTVTEPAVVLIEGGKLKAVGPSLSVLSDGGVLTISSGTIVPGYFDCHTHLAATSEPKYDGQDYYFMALNHPTALRALEGAAHAREMLEAGFTSVRDVGNGGDHADLELARAIKWGLVPGPKMQAAGRIIAPFGGQFDARVSPKQLENPEYAFADSRDEMRRAVRENAYYGADWIKVLVNSGKGYQYSVDDLKFIVDEAAHAKRKVAAHCIGDAACQSAVAAGVASIEHGWDASDETLKEMKRRGIFLVSTPFTVKELLGLGWSPEKAAGLHAWHVSDLRRAVKLGVTQAFGTDIQSASEGGQTRGTKALGYITSYIEAGMPPMDILKTLTIEGARLTGTDSQRGALKPGLAADLLVLDADPRKSPEALTQVLAVVKDGVLVSRGPNSSNR